MTVFLHEALGLPRVARGDGKLVQSIRAPLHFLSGLMGPHWCQGHRRGRRYLNARLYCGGWCSVAPRWSAA